MANIKRTTGEKTFDILNVIFMVLICIVTIYPFWYLIIFSLDSVASSRMGNTIIWPGEFTLSNYAAIAKLGGIFKAMRLSIMRVVISTPISLLITSMAAFALSRKEIWFRNFIITVFFITMIIGGGLIPGYLLLNSLHLINTFWVYVLPGAFGVWNFMVFKTMLKTSVPDELIEAALMDGSTFFRIYFKIVIPLSLPCFAALGLFNAVGQWNDWFAGLYYVSDSWLVPVQSYLYMFVNNGDLGQRLTAMSGTSAYDPSMISPYTVKIAAVVFTTVPILLVYPFLQKYFVKGVLIGAIKE